MKNMFVLKKDLQAACISHYLGKDYPKACKNNHGHNYKFQIEIGGTELNKYDMLVDFGDIKKMCNNWIQENWDHKMIFASFQTKGQELWKKMGWEYVVFPIKGANTTAESMAYFLANKFYTELKKKYSNIVYLKVSIWETDDSVASYEVGD